MMSKIVWKGALNFGLISVNVGMCAAARAEKQTFTTVNRATKNKVKQLTTDSVTGEVLGRGDTQKAATLDGGPTVYVDQEEIAALLPDLEKAIEVLEFVKLEQVDPLYFDSSFYLVPDGPHEMYEVLRCALFKSKAAALARLVKGNREELAIIRPVNHVLVLHTMFLAGEVRDTPFYPDSVPFVDDETVKTARSFIRAKSGPWQPNKYENRFAKALLELLESKANPVDQDELKAKLKASIAQAKSAKRAG